MALAFHRNALSRRTRARRSDAAPSGRTRARRSDAAPSRRTQARCSVAALVAAVVAAGTGAGRMLWPCLLATVLGCSSSPPSARAAAPVYGYTCLDVHPHDPDAFTQGLIYEDGYLYEGTGLFGASSLRKVDLESGVVLKRRDLPAENFGEGITALRDTIYQITWQDHVGYAWREAEEFELLESFAYEWEGWGLTHNGTHLIASDGSATLRYLEPRTRQVVGEIQVRDGGVPVPYLNELEFVHGRVYANVLPSNRVAVIVPSTGDVEAWLDLSGLADSVASYPNANILNGIAFDLRRNRLLVTGKRWPKLFEIDSATLHPAGSGEAQPPPGGVLDRLPNPYLRPSGLSFSLPEESNVSLRVFDAQGKLRRVLAGEERAAGSHRVELDLGGLPAGVYLVRFASAGLAEARKIHVLR